MLHTHSYTVATISIRRRLTRVRAIALPLVITASANISGIGSILPQPAYGSEYAWCARREGAAQRDFVTREQCLRMTSWEPLMNASPTRVWSLKRRRALAR